MSEAILVNVRVTKNLEHETLNSTIPNVYLSYCLFDTPYHSAQVLRNGCFLHNFSQLLGGKTGDQVSNSIWKIYSNVRELTGS